MTGPPTPGPVDAIAVSLADPASLVDAIVGFAGLHDAVAASAGGLDGLVALAAGPVDLPLAAGALTAAVGLFVAYQALRGYRRNFSRPMLYLGVGILFVTTVSFVVPQAVAAVGASDAVVVLVMTLLDVIGLSAILYALTGA